jgi:hypothetical protein
LVQEEEEVVVVKFHQPMEDKEELAVEVEAVAQDLELGPPLSLVEEQEEMQEEEDLVEAEEEVQVWVVPSLCTIMGT